MDVLLNDQLSEALEIYKRVAATTSPEETQEDHMRVAGLGESLLNALRTGDTVKAKLYLLAFSRQVSDSYSAQPPEFKLLSERVAAISKSLL